ncbi:MAG: FKBP-type peptidyl-prolyl cis-trans isomerase [Gordonia sp. (in: high G+C Gram-positive bacteria)]|uniref:FKBP-type peptidyl-prolyl cis-trans isomerase n=1 Tax=Gordonia sp. (in: high G+C Gram-positive bacteria) TaxID=84139 RepID=UPI003C7070E4
MKLKALMLVPMAVGAFALAGCSSTDSSDPSSTSDSVATQTDATESSPQAAELNKTATEVNDGCPVVPAKYAAQQSWTVKGTEGCATFTVTDDAKNLAPMVQIVTPFKVDATEVHTLIPGNGATVAETTTVDVFYEGVNGTTGAVFDSGYQRGESTQFPANGVVEGFKKALVGQKVGSTVAVVIPTSEGYPQGTPDGSINAGDTIVFVLKIVGAQN